MVKTSNIKFVIFYFSIVLGLLFLPKITLGQSSCGVTNAWFVPYGFQTIQAGQEDIRVIIETNGQCVNGNQINLQVHETGGPMLKDIVFNQFDATKKFASAVFTSGGQGCTDNSCNLYLRAFYNGNDIFNTQNSTEGRITYASSTFIPGSGPGVPGTYGPEAPWPNNNPVIAYGETKDSVQNQISEGSCFVRINSVYGENQEFGDNINFNESASGGIPRVVIEGETDGCSSASGGIRLKLEEVSTLTNNTFINDTIDNTEIIIRNINGGYMKFIAKITLGELDCADGVNDNVFSLCTMYISTKLTDDLFYKVWYDFPIKYKKQGADNVKFGPTDITLLDREGNVLTSGGGFTNSIAPLKASPCFTDDVNGDGVGNDPGTIPGCLGLLAPLPDYDRFVAGENPFTNWVNNTLRVAIGIASLLAVVMLVILGAQYAATSAFTKKSGYKERITDIFLGLGILLGIYLILSIINPSLLVLEPNIPESTLVFDPASIDIDVAGNPPPGGLALPGSVICTNPSSPSPLELNKFINSTSKKLFYRLGGKGGNPPFNADTKTCDGRPCSSFCPTNGVCLDCSGFVGTARSCGGYSNLGWSTASIFSSANNPTKITSYDKSSGQVNGNYTLQPGDLIGYSPSQAGTTYGHVGIYLGDNKVAHAQGGNRTNPGPTIQDVDSFIQSLSNKSKNQSGHAWLVK